MISAQNLAKVSRKMKTYAVAWVHPDRKLCTTVDNQSDNNPTWNDKFVFRVDDEFLYGETSAIMIEIYAVNWFRDVQVGTVRVTVGNLIPPPQLHRQHHIRLGMRFVALQVRRRSGCPQGILNIGVAILDPSKRSMPLYTQNASAIGYRHLMGEKDPRMHKEDEKNSDEQNQLLLPWNPKPELRRIRSDTSSMIGLVMVPKRTTNKRKAGSMVNGSAYEKQNSNASSVITGSEINTKGNKSKPDSTSNGLGYGALTMAKYKSRISGGKNTIKKNHHGSFDNISSLKFNQLELEIGKLNFGNQNRMNLNGGVPLISESELGPSASEVAAKVARKRNHSGVEEMESEIISSWSMETGMEGLQSKLERWRTELPPAYDHSDLSSSLCSGHEIRRRIRSSESDIDGVFSCFITLGSFECSIVCGGPSTRKKSGRVKRSSSLSSLSFL